MTTASRESYHHGDLRHALLSAGLELARAGGPDAVVLREATRQVGVSPNAAYRHFADREALLTAVSDECLAQLAAAIERLFDGIPGGTDEAVARAQLRAVGTGYVAFALGEVGLFRAAFSGPPSLERRAAPTKAGASGHSPLGLLRVALDGFVASGIMPPARRPQAEFLAWSSVHGVAMLCIGGPLRGLPREQSDDVTQRVIDMVEAGLTAP